MSVLGDPPYHIAVVGATGAVGRVMLSRLLDSEIDITQIVPFASPSSAGTVIDGIGEVQALTPTSIEGFDIALFSAGGEISAEWAPQFTAAGAIVIDNSSQWRMHDDVPLVVSEVNPAALEDIPLGIIANPNCTAMIAMLPLKALHDAFGLRGVVATSFQAASGAGQRGVDELFDGFDVFGTNRDETVHSLTHYGDQSLERLDASVHTAPLTYNVVPLIGEIGANGESDEEEKFRNESRKILRLPQLPVTVTCVRVPTVVGHAISLQVVLEREPVNVEAVLQSFPNLQVDQLPTPLKYAGGDTVAVGRIRVDVDNSHVLHCFVVGDNLRKGAASNAVDIAQLLA